MFIIQYNMDGNSVNRARNRIIIDFFRRVHTAINIE